MGGSIAVADRHVPTEYEGTLEPNYFCRHWNSKRAKYCRARAGQGTDHPGVGRCRWGGGATPVKHGLFSTIEREDLRQLMAHHAANPDPLNLLPDLAKLRALADDFINRHERITAALLAWHESYRGAERPLPELALQAVQDLIDELEARIGPVPDEPPVRMEPEPQPHGGWLRRDRVDEGDADELRIHHSMRIVRKLLEDLRRPADDGKPRQLPDIADAYRILGEVGRMVARVERVNREGFISRPTFARVLDSFGRVVKECNRIADPDERLRAIDDGWKRVLLVG